MHSVCEEICDADTQKIRVSHVTAGSAQPCLDMWVFSQSNGCTQVYIRPTVFGCFVNHSIQNTMATAPVANYVVEQAIATGEDLNELRAEGFYTDFEIRTKEGIPLKAHRLGIGANCPSLKTAISTKRTLNLSCFPSM